MRNEIWSHPGKPLVYHLSEVAKVATNSVRDKILDLEIKYNGTALKNINDLVVHLVYLAAAFHDLGKATKYFQKYIRNPQIHNDKYKSHALLSALFVYFISRRFLDDKGLDQDLSTLLAVFTFSSVKRHHGTLGNLSEEILIDNEWQEILSIQIKSIDPDQASEIINYLLSGLDIEIDWDEFLEFIEKIEYNNIFDDFSYDVLQDSLEDIDENTKISLFYIH
ncbi:MAG: CRISPR-associated endonuclease Cas3'', partial [bacterium]